MRFQILGGVDAFRDGTRVDTGARRQRCVLAVLLVSPGAPITVPELIDRVWAGDAPQRARGALHNYISALRALLSPDVALARRADGYALEIDPLDVDLFLFRSLSARGAYDEALALWHGTPFGPLDTPYLNDVRESLQRERHAVELDRNDHLLAAGRHGELVRSLPDAVAAHPFDERLIGQYMLALTLGGRPADALRHYDTTRRLLADELGTDPSPALQSLHLNILTPSSGGPSPVPPAGDSPVSSSPVSSSPELASALPGPATRGASTGSGSGVDDAPTSSDLEPFVAVPSAPASLRPIDGRASLLSPVGGRPRRPRSWLLTAGAVLLLLLAGGGAMAAIRGQHAAAPSPAPSYPPRLTPLLAAIPDDQIVAIVNRRSATSVSAAYVVDVENWSTEKGARTHLWHWRDDGDFRNQMWRVRRLPDGRRQFVNLFSSLCLSGTPGARDVVQLPCTPADDAQDWTLHSDGSLANGTGLRGSGLQGSGLNEPGLNEPGLNEPGLNEPGLNEPGLNEPGLNEPGPTCLTIRDGLMIEDTSLQVAPCAAAWTQQWYLVARP